jgi:hypothetical protein
LYHGLLALVGVAVWTLYLQAPSLSGELEVTATVNWSRRADPATCEVGLQFVVNNMGKTSVTVSDLTVRVWDFDRPYAQPTREQLVVVNDFENRSKPLLTQVVRDTPLKMPLAPGEIRSDSILLVLPLTTSRRVLLDGSTTGSIPGWLWIGSQQRPMQAYVWDTVCTK